MSEFASKESVQRLYDIIDDFKNDTNNKFITITERVKGCELSSEAVKELTNAVQSIEKTLITIDSGMNTLNRKQDDISKVQEKMAKQMNVEIADVKSQVKKQSEKGKFDYMQWINGKIGRASCRERV